MNYPVWYLPGVGGGTLIAVIAVTHVFVSHFAVGGGLYLVVSEHLGLREKNQDLLDFTRRYAKFFLLATLVYGSLTGVGIWFVISLVQPAGTSLLIHNFVFGWATEWVFFVVEITAITVYFYTFGRMEPRAHMAVGWVYFAAAWLSLFVINGIITFMLTPGGWTGTGNFWAGFFNPTFWPSLLFRTLIAISLAGIFALMATAYSRTPEIKRSMTRFSGWWAVLPLVAAAPVGWWYLQTLPEEARRMVLQANPTIQSALDHGLYALGGLAVLVLIFTLLRPAWHNRVVSFLILTCALIVMGAFEWTREAARRPYIVNGSAGVMYSSGIASAELEKINQQGFLATAGWTAVKEVRDETLLMAGEEIFKFQCYACHTIGGLNNDILARTAGFDFESMLDYIDNIHEIRYFMPPFAGTKAEARALAAFIVQGLHGEEIPSAGKEPVSAKSGKDLFRTKCTGCHPQSLIAERTAGWDEDKTLWALDHLSELNPAMPNFKWTDEERERLAEFILSLQKGDAK